jgi:Ca2+-binding EF-hand superfamily protein
MKFAIAPALLLGCVISFCAVLQGCSLLPGPLSAVPAGNASPAAQLNSDHRTVDLNEAKVASAAPVGNAPPAALQHLDSDHDGTVDLNEAKVAAAAVFDRLDADHDGTLDRRELRGRLNAAQFAAADPDHDGTLSHDEYMALVEKRFNAANPDNDDTLDAKELRSPAGRNLLRLVM